MIERSILITGCSSGIGLSAAKVLKARGWRVLATARASEDLAMLEREAGVEALHLELADPASVAACAAEALKRTEGKLFALFNNGAYGQVGAVEDLKFASAGGVESWLIDILCNDPKPHPGGWTIDCSDVNSIGGGDVWFAEMIGRADPTSPFELC